MSIIYRICIELFWNDIYCIQCISCIVHTRSSSFCKNVVLGIKYFFTLCVTPKSWKFLNTFSNISLIRSCRPPKTDRLDYSIWYILRSTTSTWSHISVFNSTQLFEIGSSLHSKFFVTKVNKKYIVNMLYHYKSKLLDILKLFENRML